MSRFAGESVCRLPASLFMAPLIVEMTPEVWHAFLYEAMTAELPMLVRPGDPHLKTPEIRAEGLGLIVAADDRIALRFLDLLDAYAPRFDDFTVGLMQSTFQEAVGTPGYLMASRFIKGQHEGVSRTAYVNVATPPLMDQLVRMAPSGIVTEAAVHEARLSIAPRSAWSILPPPPPPRHRPGDDGPRAPRP